MKVWVIDAARCNGCYNCQIACKDEHVDNDWTPIAKPQPDTGQFWMKMTQETRGTVPKVRVSYLPILCMHCDNAPCIPACPVEGGIYRRPDGLVIIDPTKCNGCRNCVDACPYGCIYFNQELNIAQKCTGCAHLLDKGWQEPRCVDACMTEAIKFGEESDFGELINRAEVLHPEYGTKPRVYYLNLPRKFIGGTVYDPNIKEIIEGATCTLTDTNSGSTFTAVTDGFGDFWFEGLGESTFSLTIEANGKSRTIDPISTARDVNLGDIPLP